MWPEDDKSVHLNKLPKGKEIEIDISQNLVTWEILDFLKDLFCHERITMQKSPWRNSIDLFFVNRLGFMHDAFFDKFWLVMISLKSKILCMMLFDKSPYTNNQGIFGMFFFPKHAFFKSKLGFFVVGGWVFGG